jgi:hypothetical protein
VTFRYLLNKRGFFSDYYLGTVFGRTGTRARRRTLTDKETDVAYARFRRMRERAEGRVTEASSCRELFLRPLFRDILGFHLGAGDERIFPLFASAEAEAGGTAPLLVAYCGGWDEDLDAGAGAARPAARVESAIGARQMRHGVLATGERIRLVRAPGDGPRGAYIEVDLAGLDDEDDRESFAAFLLLFSRAAFEPEADGHTRIASIERESREHAERVSEDLKGAVFSAAELMVSALIAARDGDSRAVSDDALRTYRDAALLGLYRILFILYAESRDPRLQEHEVYNQSYSISGVVDELMRDPEREWTENRSSLWTRLRAVFAIYDRGLPAIAPWRNIPPRGSDFFSAHTSEGRVLDEARLPDSTVVRILMELTTTRPRAGIGRERVSFAELDVESLGAVYEGLLEHEPRIAEGTSFEVRVQGRAFALSTSDLTRLCDEKSLELTGPFALVADTPLASVHRDRPDDDGDEEDDEETDEDSEASEEGGSGLKKGATARVTRRFEAGEFHFVPGPARKGSSSFYTPRLLVIDLVRHALGPLVVRSTAAEIEKLRVIDAACGSAHFLVEAMRFLGRELHHAYVDEYGGAPPQFENTTGLGWDNDWRASDEEARVANSEARAWCKRRIAERCLFGVDRNPTAVQLARVALWIESVAGDRPLTFFAHHIRAGNSLLGTWLDTLDRPPVPKLGNVLKGQLGLFEAEIRKALAEAAAKRRLIDAKDTDALRREGVEPDTVDEQRYKERLEQEAKEATEAGRLLFSLRTASAFIPEIWADWLRLASLVADPAALRAEAMARPWWSAFARLNDAERFFHWELEFPEVFSEEPGFDAVLGNPPWDKLKADAKDFYSRFDVLIRAYTGNQLDVRIRELTKVNPAIAPLFGEYETRVRQSAAVLRAGGDFPLNEARSGDANEDVSKYFIDRAARIVARGGRVGLVVPSVFYNGDGCVGIRRFLLNEAGIERFYGFENRNKIFPIDSRYKFVNLVFAKGESTEHFNAAFMRRHLGELNDEASKPWMVRISRAEIQSLSPETFAFLEYRNARDQEVIAKMYQCRPRLGSTEPNGWHVQLFRHRNRQNIFDFSRAQDAELVADSASGNLHAPERILGAASRTVSETIGSMRNRGYWPVFEGKHIDQFLVGIKPVRWWLSVAQAEKKYGKRPRPEATLVFRETARNTDERTCIAAVLPQESAGAHTLTGMLVRNVDPAAACVVLNSLCFDYALRLRTAGTHVSFTYILPMSVPPAAVVPDLPSVATQLAWETGMEHITHDEGTWPVLWQANRAVAEAYGLSPDDFEHILDSFPVMARKRPAFVAYLRERLAEWRLAAGAVA